MLPLARPESSEEFAAFRRHRSRRRLRRRRLAAFGGLVAVTTVIVIPSALQGQSQQSGKSGLTSSSKGRLLARSSGGLPQRGDRLALPALLPARTLTVPILMYHLIGDADASAPPITRALTVSPRAFADEMRWIVGHGFHAITQQQLFRALEFGAPLPAKPVMITFDDGYRDVLWNAAPILARLHMPATAYVITGRVSGRDSSFLTWPELRELERLDVEIGSHTVHHVELTGLTSVAALDELVVSRRELERHLGHPVQWFAYPAGAVDAAVVPLVREAGYVLAVTTRPGAEQNARDPLELHRYEVLATSGVAGVSSLLSG
jgi:peptidoglycan/xylan/chitin deacetylase (PgdA/CDA1 family)